jgi:outer membrane autotransporter protein
LSFSDIGTLSLVAGDGVVLNANKLTFGTNGKLNITGSAQDGQTVISTANEVLGFELAEVLVAGNANGSHFLLVKGADLSEDKHNILLRSELAWHQDDNSQHGNFHLEAEDNVFDVAQDLENGVVADGWNGTELNKTGLGTLILSGNNTYSGNTNVEAGTLALVGSVAGNMNVAGGATLEAHKGSSVGGDLNAGGANLRFVMPNDVGHGDTLLNVAGNANLGDANLNIGFAADAELSALKVGEDVNLLTAKTMEGWGDAPREVEVKVGAGRKFTFEVNGVQGDDAMSLVANLASLSASAEGAAKAWSEGFAAGLMLVNAGADAAANQAMSAAVNSAQAEGSGSAFGVVVGGSQKVETGSYVKMKSVSGLTGASFNKNGFTVGAFFEYGNGSYDTYNALDNVASENGGDADYVGGGLLAKFQKGGAYVEASARGGRLTNEFTAEDLIDVSGVKGNYELKSNYYSAHLGVGYAFALSERSDLDVYVKGFYSNVAGDNVTAASGDELTFEDSTSVRARLGARWNKGFGAASQFYVGAAYEREFDGKAEASVGGEAIGIPELKGNTGIGELGVSFRSSAESAFSFDLGVQGYVGDRKGVTGNLNLKYRF